MACKSRISAHPVLVRTILSAVTSFARTVEVVQRYQINHCHENTEHKEPGPEGTARAQGLLPPSISQAAIND